MIGKELFNFTCGEYLGSGISRHVFAYEPDDRYVIKMEVGATCQNWLEWRLWHDLTEHENQKWLAPCIRISGCGMWMVQARTKKPPENYKWPEKLPAFLTDQSHENYGLYKGRLVAHDYGVNLCNNYARSKRMRRADWH